jgi:ribosomal protein S18 acetylase RimI-like enzyme
MPTIQIRAAQPGDLDSVAQLFNAYRQFYEQPDDLPLATAFITERFSKKDSAIALAEDSNGVPLGFTQIYPSHCSVLAAPIGVLYDLFVTPQARSKGVGRALLLAATAHGKAKGMHRLDLTTARTNTAAQSLYESLRWQRDEIFLSYSLNLHC